MNSEWTWMIWGARTWMDLLFIVNEGDGTWHPLTILDHPWAWGCLPGQCTILWHFIAEAMHMADLIMNWGQNRRILLVERCGKMFTDGSEKSEADLGDTVCCWLCPVCPVCPVLGTASLDSFFYSFCNLAESAISTAWHNATWCTVHTIFWSAMVSLTV